MDIAEQSEYQEQLARNVGIRLAQAAIERERREHCIECDEKIPEQRTSCRCVNCQTKIEKRLTRR